MKLEMSRSQMRSPALQFVKHRRAIGEVELEESDNSLWGKC